MKQAEQLLRVVLGDEERLPQSSNLAYTIWFGLDNTIIFDNNVTGERVKMEYFQPRTMEEYFYQREHLIKQVQAMTKLD